MKRMKIITGWLYGVTLCGTVMAMSSRKPAVPGEDSSVYRVQVTRTQVVERKEETHSTSCAYDLHVHRTELSAQTFRFALSVRNVSISGSAADPCWIEWLSALSNTVYRADWRNGGRRVDLEGFKPLMKSLLREWMQKACPERDMLMFLQWFGDAAMKRVLMRMFAALGTLEIERTVKDPLLGDILLHDRYGETGGGRIHAESSWRIRRHKQDLPAEWNISDYRDEPAVETGTWFRAAGAIGPERGMFTARQTIHVTGGPGGGEQTAVRLIQHLTFELTGGSP